MRDILSDMQLPQKSALPATALPRAWYAADLAEFLRAEPHAIVGQLALNSAFADDPAQKQAWVAEIEFLQERLAGLSGAVFLEFNIPRMGRRIDAVLVLGPVVFVVEFKVGEKAFEAAALDQVWDYALDLKNFHEASHAVAIVPVLVATEAKGAPAVCLRADADQVYRPIPIDPSGFRGVLELALRTVSGEAVNEQQWSRAPYRPTPTIVEAARCLYAQHSVEAIARYDAGAENLRVTSRRIEELVD